MVAQINFFFAAVILVLFHGDCLTALGQRSRDCENPPGGRITCETSQAAICKVNGGKVDGYCRTPRKAATEAEVKAELLTLILGEEITPFEMGFYPKYQRVINEGRAVDNGTVITFSLPDLLPYIEKPQIKRPDFWEQKQNPKSTPPNEGTKPGVIIKPQKDTQKAISKPTPR